MTEQELNLKAYDLVKLLKQLEEDDNYRPKNDPKKFRGSTSHLPVLDLTNKIIDSPIIRSRFAEEISDFVITIGKNKIVYGFDVSDYIEYYKFIDNLSKFNSLNKTVSLDFLKKKVLFWIIDVYQNNQSKIDLVSYILNLLSDEIKTQTFYYPILNLSIEDPFKIGKAEFTYFTKEYFDEYYEYLKTKGNKSEESFNDVYRKYQGRVFVAIEITAEDEKAEELAYNQASLAVDIIKLLSPTICYPSEKCSIDLEKRSPYQYEHISIEKGKKFDFKLSLSAHQGQFEINNNMVKGIETNMLLLFSEILNLEPTNNFEFIIISSTRFMAKCISETDLHLRISQLIMIIESIFLLDEDNYKMENKSKRRMSFFLYSNNESQRKELYDTLSTMYEIRHKMTHKFQREYIEQQKLGFFQMSLIDVILGLVNNIKRIKDRSVLIGIIEDNIKSSL